MLSGLDLFKKFVFFLESLMALLPLIIGSLQQ